MAILQAGERGRYLARLDLPIQGGRPEIQGYRLIPVDDAAPEDPRLAAEVRALAARLQQEVVVLGRSALDLDARREIIRRRESNFGDWMADLARGLTGADVALFNAGTFRTFIRAGKVRVKDVYEAFPFGNELVTATLPGSQLLAALERSAGLDLEDNPPPATAATSAPPSMGALSAAESARWDRRGSVCAPQSRRRPAGVGPGSAETGYGRFRTSHVREGLCAEGLPPDKRPQCTGGKGWREGQRRETTPTYPSRRRPQRLVPSGRRSVCAKRYPKRR